MTKPAPSTFKGKLTSYDRRITRLERRVAPPAPTVPEFVALATEVDLLADRLGVLEVPPAFQAFGNSSIAKSGTSVPTALPITLLKFNRGNHYNTSSSRFTAPLAGVYQFSVSTVQSTTTGGPELGFAVNGVLAYSTVAIGYFNNYQTFGTTALLDLAAGDFVQVFWQNNNNVAVTLDLTRTYFSGHLIGIN